ncbi:hypothetical protein [Sphingomonas sp.]|uniref:hypothetical protein n=1 Tax=Sphingomonas sp. TaxID=28214 RepID=UPI001B24AD57|nr:hypothetical protein [Sphingomonas sp.]MBO9715166.1 hypothetical protein [Sphingomonas sp.]
MRVLTIGILAATTLLGACTDYDSRPGYTNGGYRSYDWNRPDPAYNGYYADRYYRRDTTRYREYRMGRGDRVYRGEDGRYYCRRSDGTTGLIVGALAGGVLGNIIAPGGSETLGTIIGAGAGAAIGASVDKGDARCE